MIITDRAFLYPPYGDYGDYGINLNPVDALKGAASAVMSGGKLLVSIGGEVIEFVGDQIPKPAEYDPENLAVVGWTDPIRFAVLAAAASVVIPGSGLALAPFLAPNVAGLSVAVPLALARGGPSRVEEKILRPIFSKLGSKAKGVVNALGCSVTGSVPVCALAVYAQELARGMIKRGDVETLAKQTAVGVHFVALDLGVLRRIVGDPASLKDGGTWLTISGVFKRLEGLGGPVGALAAQIGSASYAFAKPVALLSAGGEDALKSAARELATSVLGFDPMKLTQYLAISRDEASNYVRYSLNSATDIAKSKLMLGVLSNGLSGLRDAFAKVELPYLSGEMNKLLGPLYEVVEMVMDTLNTALGLTKPASAPASGQVIEGQLVRRGMVLLPAGGAARAPGGVAGPLLAAGAGFLVGGPPGAAVGGGAALLLRNFKKR